MKLPTIAEDRAAAFTAYATLCKNYTGNVRGRETHIELIAIGAAESGLDNMAVGRNDINGTPEGANTGATGILLHYSLGLGWLQHDSGWLEADRDVNGIAWSIEQIRSDPKFSLHLIAVRPGFVLFQGVDRTYVDFRRWAVWPRRSDAFVREAANAYDALA